MIINLPFSVTIPRKTKDDKVFTLNLNTFRNAHHMVMNQAKAQWVKVVHFYLPLDPMPEPPYRFIYTVYPRTGRAFDLGNVCPAIQKFTDDALIELGLIKDDNYKHIRAIQYEFGEIDKYRPRCELEIIHWVMG